MKQHTVAFALDIETAPDHAAIARLGIQLEIKYGNLKDPDKRAEKAAEAAVRLEQGAALDPHLGRILCASLACNTPQGPIVSTLHATTNGSVFAPATNDDSTLSGIINELAKGNPNPLAAALCAHQGMLHAYLTSLGWDTEIAPRLITFNGTQFDIPFAARRAAIHGMIPATSTHPDIIHPYKTRTTEGAHYDVYQALEGATTSADLGYKRNLKFYSSLFEINADFNLDADRIDKAELWKLWNNPDGRFAVEQVCQRDALAVLALASKIN